MVVATAPGVEHVLVSDGHGPVVVLRKGDEPVDLPLPRVFGLLQQGVLRKALWPGIENDAVAALGWDPYARAGGRPVGPLAAAR